MTAIHPLAAQVCADALPECCWVPRVLTYHPDPDGDGWFTACTLRPWMPPGYRARCRVITRAQGVGYVRLSPRSRDSDSRRT